MIYLQLLQVFAGPSPHADDPVLLARLRGSAELSWIDSACDRLERGFPDWLQPLPVLQSGRMVSPMQRLALTAVRWALGALNEVRGDLRCAGLPNGPGIGPLTADLYLGYHDVGVSRQALELALRALLLTGQEPDFSPARLQPALAELWKLCRRHHPDWQARLLMQAARARDIPVLPFVARHWQYGWGARSRVFFETASNIDGILGAQIARSKLQTKAALAALGVAAPHHVLVRDERELEQAVATVGWPCVIKPVDLGGGKGVTANIATPAALGAAYENARRYSQGPLMVETHCPGQDHRLFVLGGKLVAAVLREPPTVVGDGVSSLKQLVQVLNAGRSSSLVRSGYLVPVAFDDILHQHLAAQGLTLASVPAAGQRVSLRSNANRSTGGCARDVTAAVHPAVRALAETVADTLGLNAAGLDYLTHDISLPPGVGGGMMIEVNSTPGLAVLVTAGLEPVALAGRVLGEGVGRIAVTLTVIGSSTLAAARAEFEVRVPRPGLAWVCGDLAAVAGLPLRAAAGGPWELVRCALRHRSVQQLELVCTAEQLLQHGMPVDRVAQVRLCGVRLPDGWMALLRRRADSVIERESWLAEPVQGALCPSLAVAAGEGRMRITRLRYLQGANLWSDRSGLLVWLELDQQTPQWLAWRPDGDAAALVLVGLERLLPTLQREPRRLTAQALSTAKQPALELLLAIYTALLRDWTVRPGRACLLALGPKACRLFLPADHPELAQQACRLVLSCLAALPAWLAAGVPSEPAGWRQGYPDFVARAQRLAPATARLAHRMLPAADGGRVPVAGITGSVGKTTTCRMLAWILGSAGHQVALATTQGIYVGSKPLRLGDLAWGGNGAVLMQDPCVTAGVFEMARGGLIKRGLGLAGVDVGAVLNVHDNHLGLDGVHSRETLAQVKRLVVRHARKMAVLNADDPLCFAMAKGLQVPICLVSEHPDRIELQHHLAAGGHAVLLESHQGSEHIVLRAGASVLGRVAVAALPCSWNGAFRPAVANAMFALAVAHGMGVEFGLGVQALAAFESNYESNPGRMNFIAGLPFRLLLNWADGPQAFAGLAHFVRHGDMPDDRTLVFYVVGNRQDEFIAASARAVAGAFTRYVCTEMEENRRGRPEGEVAVLLAQGLRQAGVPEQAIAVEPSSDAACRRALASTPAGALLVLATYRSDRAMAAVHSIWPKTD